MGYSVKALGRLLRMKWSQLVEHHFGVAFQCAFPHQTSIKPTQTLKVGWSNWLDMQEEGMHEKAPNKGFDISGRMSIPQMNAQ
jgi:hypothetical protein